MSAKALTVRQTIGFGCPNKSDTHHFVVDIPASRTGRILITESYSALDVVERCTLPKQIWVAFSEDVQYEFNVRLKEKRLSTSRWKVGENKVERLLGKELLCLAWAVEQADLSVIPQAILNWKGFKPEERWWLCTMTAAATGRRSDAGTGWRKALYHIMVENPVH